MGRWGGGKARLQPAGDQCHRRHQNLWRGQEGGFQDYRTDGWWTWSPRRRSPAGRERPGSLRGWVGPASRLRRRSEGEAVFITAPLAEPVTVEPMRAFPPIRDLVTDVSWNFRVKQGITRFSPRPPDASDGTWRMAQADVDRVQEFRKCIECFLCQDVCHVIRDHQLTNGFIGPRFLTFAAALEMHPLDTADRIPDLQHQHGIGYCNITKCCTNVCPEEIKITDNAIIPLKERTVDRFYDPVTRLLRMFSGKS